MKEPEDNKREYFIIIMIFAVILGIILGMNDVQAFKPNSAEPITIPWYAFKLK